MSAEQKAFTFAVDKINRESNRTRLELDIRLVKGNDTFGATRAGELDKIGSYLASQHVA